MSVSQTERAFKEAYSVSPIRYALLEKLSVAKKLFTSTSMTVREVAEKLSFDNVNYFSRQFKKAYGISPQRFIREKKSKK
ncbi:MAG: AraC family transcriptional regulator [Clostridia bacterium]|nr:AraC family transcriptional regulator [Clostridia bacterium]